MRVERSCRVFVLGGFRAEVDGTPVAPNSWRHRRGADVVKLLALAPGHRIHRERVIDVLWPDLDPEAGSANLRKAVHFARRALGSERAVVTEGAMLQLWPSGPLSVDVDEFDREADAAARSGDPEAAAKAAASYGGDVLPEDPFEPWTQAPRDRYRRRHLKVLKLAGLWDRVLQLDPVDEEAHRAIIRAQLEAGDRHGAMRQFEQLREALHEELGVGPDAASVALYQEVLAMEGEEPPTPAERAGGHLSMALVAFNRMDLEEAEREARTARELAVGDGLGRELGEASALLGMVAHARGRWRDLFREEFRHVIEEMPAFAEPVFDAHLCLGEFWLYGPDGLADGEAFARELLGMAEANDSQHGRALATLQIGEAELLSGRLDAADADLASAVALHRMVRARSGEALASERLAEAALARGHGARARRLLSGALGLAGDAPLSSHLVVRVLGAMVQSAKTPSDAEVVVREAERTLAGREVCEPCSMGFRVAAAISCARAGDLETARRYLGEAERAAGMWQGGPWQAAVWEARGELRLAEGDGPQAAALLREAADLFGRAGHPLAERRCLAGAEAALDRIHAGNGPGTPGP